MSRHSAGRQQALIAHLSTVRQYDARNLLLQLGVARDGSSLGQRLALAPARRHTTCASLLLLWAHTPGRLGPAPYAREEGGQHMAHHTPQSPLPSFINPLEPS